MGRAGRQSPIQWGYFCGDRPLVRPPHALLTRCLVHWSDIQLAVRLGDAYASSDADGLVLSYRYNTCQRP
jgi:hypothetical protein